jgi:peptide/nickel transport system permease protein
MSRVLAVLFFAFVFVSPLFAPYDPLKTDPPVQLQPPSQAHPLGTDLLGRDVLSRTLYGGQRTLTIAALATLIALVPGILIGLFSGMSARWLDNTIQIGVSALLAFPALMVGLVVITLTGSGALPLALAAGIMQISPCIRVVRGAVLDVRSQTYMEAAASLGASRLRLTMRHVLPNIRPAVVSYALVVFSFSVLNNAALSFLGLGGDPSAADWGLMLADGRTAFRAAPWIGAAPGVGITVTILLLAWLARDVNRRG